MKWIGIFYLVALGVGSCFAYKNWVARIKAKHREDLEKLKQEKAPSKE